ncbi:MAG: class I SAM-dependent methyltransferase [Janthinobacterium lividum]
MQAGTPSRTAYRVALRRAAHQVVDAPRVFADPLALRILGMDAGSMGAAAGDLRAPTRPHSVALRAFLVARSRFAEDALAAAVHTHARLQYVLLGAGLDTFAYRNPYTGVHVFEVDHPDTQAWKLSLLGAAGLAIPASATHVPVDFQQQSLREQLALAGFDPSHPAVFAWLGVVPYLSAAAFTSTLQYLARCAAGSVLVMDYSLPRAALPANEQLAFDSLSARVAAAGEPFQSFFLPDELHTHLASERWGVMEDLDRDAINRRYFAGRSDHLRCLGSGGHLLTAMLR